MIKIIIIEDDSGIRESTRLVFEPSQYNVAIYPNADPIMKGQFELPHIFIIDRQLPGMDGLDLCRHLKNQPATRNIPVIMVSASPSINKLFREAGADDFMNKPYTIKHLRDLVARYTQ